MTPTHRSLASRAAAVIAAAALTLTACGQQEAANPTSASGLADVTVADAADDATTPGLTFEPGSIEVDETEERVLKAGEGAELTGSELLSFDYAIFSGTSGKELGSSYPGGPVGLDLQDQTVLPGLTSALTGQKVGSRVLVALPPKDAFGEAGNPQLGVEGAETLVFLVDILSAITPLEQATGTEVAPKEGLPTVEITPGEQAVITMPDGFKNPDKTVVQPLIQGEGAEVASGQTIRVAYTGATAKDGKVFDSSAGSAQGYAEFPIGVGRVIKGWDTGLVGQKVGSRVLLVIPASEGYGDQGSPPNIAGGDTLVFVVDILAAY